MNLQVTELDLTDVGPRTQAHVRSYQRGLGVTFRHFTRDSQSPTLVNGKFVEDPLYHVVIVSIDGKDQITRTGNSKTQAYARAVRALDEWKPAEHAPIQYQKEKAYAKSRP